MEGGRGEDKVERGREEDKVERGRGEDEAERVSSFHAPCWHDLSPPLTARVIPPTQIASLRTMLSKVTSDLAGKKSELNQLRELVQQREARAGQLEKEAAAAKDKLNNAEKNTMTAEERTNQLEAMLADEKRDQKLLERDLAAAREQQYRATQQAHDLKEKYQLVEQAIAAHHAANRNTTSRMRALEAELAQQEKMQYQQDFQITQLQRKFDRLEGKRSKEEEDEFQAQLSELREELEQQQQTRALLQRQLTRVTDSLRLQRRRLDDAVVEHQRWDERLQQLQLSNRNAEQELKDVVAQRQELIVEENVLKLEIRRVRGALNERADKVRGWKSRRPWLVHCVHRSAGQLAHSSLASLSHPLTPLTPPPRSSRWNSASCSSRRP